MIQFLLLYSAFVAISYGANPNCTIQSFSVYTIDDQPNTGLTQDNVTSYISSQQKNLVLADASTTFLSCIEGYSSTGIFGAHGGDSGEFLLALAIYSRGGAVLNESVIYDLFTSFLNTTDKSRKFYMHTDENAYNNLRNSINNTNYKNLTDKPASDADRSKILDLVTKPENIGCKVINAILNNPGTYRVPVSVTQQFIRAFFTYMWDGPLVNKLIYQITPSYTQSFNGFLEVIVRSSDGVCNDSYPLIPATIPTMQSNLFINHQNAIEYFRKQLSSFFIGLKNTNVNITTESSFKDKMDRLGELHLVNTLFTLTETVPVYVVQFNVGLKQKAAVTTGFITSNSVTTGDNDSSSAPTKSGKGWIGAIVVFVLLVVFLGVTWVLYKYYPKFFPTHGSTPLRNDSNPHRAQPKEDSEFVPLEDIAPSYAHRDDI